MNKTLSTRFSNTPKNKTSSVSPKSRARSSFGIHKQHSLCQSLQRMFRSKCKDLNIPAQSSLETRFMNTSFKQIKKRVLNIKGSGLGTNSAPKIGSIIKNCSQIAILSLSKNLLRDNGVNTLISSIKYNRSLVHLDISNNDLTPEGVQKILMSVKAHPSLYSLDLSSYDGMNRNRLAVLGSQAVADLLQENKILGILNIEGTSLGSDGLKFLAKGIKENSNLVSLNIANNLVYNLKHLALAYESSSISKLVLSYNPLGDDACEHINFMINRYRQLEILDIACCDISIKGFRVIFEALKMNKSLNVLNLRGNAARQGLPDSFVASMKMNSTLKDLNLSSCSIEDFSKLSDGLLYNRGLKLINLDSNFLRDAGAATLAKGLSLNRTLKHVDLSNNFIRSPGGRALISSFMRSPAIETIVMANNSLKNDVGEFICEVIRNNKSIKSVVLDCNPISRFYTLKIKNKLLGNHKYFQKEVIPKLKKQITSFVSNKESLSKVHKKIDETQKEIKFIQDRCQVNIQKYEEVKEMETQKYIELESNRNRLKDINRDLNFQLTQILQTIRTQTLFQNRDLQEFDLKLEIVDREIKKLNSQRILYSGSGLFAQVEKNKTRSSTEDLQKTLATETKILRASQQKLETLRKSLQSLNNKLKIS